MYVEQLTPLAGAVLWQTDPQPGSAVLPDGCMESDRGADRIVGLRFPAGVVPSRLGIPAVELRNTRRPLVELAPPAPRSAATKVGPLAVIRSGFCSS